MTKLKQPIGDNVWKQGWSNPVKFANKHIEICQQLITKCYGNISGNVVVFGGGGCNIFNIIIASICDHVTLVDYSCTMIKKAEDNCKLNNISTNNIKFICDRMENYTDLGDADYIIFQKSLSFANIPMMIKNLNKNCKKGCKIIIDETLKSIVLSLVITPTHQHQIKDIKNNKTWLNNQVKIEKLFNKNKQFKKSKKKSIMLSGKSIIPTMYLYYTVK